MPQVRDYKAPRLAAGSVSLPKIDPTTGSGVFAKAKEASSDLAKRSSDMLLKYDDSRAREGYNGFRESARQKVLEIKNLKGRDAVGSSKAYREWYEEESKLVSGDLDNTRQQNAFGVWGSSRREQDLDAISGHEALELERYNVSVHHGEITHAHGDVMAHFGDDDRIEGQLNDKGQRVGGVIQGIKDSFEKTYPGIDKSREVQAAVASARGLRIKLLSEDFPGKAAKLLESQKVSLGELYLPLKEKVHTSTVRKESQVSTDIIRSQHFKDYPAQFKAARAIEDAEVRDATTKRVKEREAEDGRIADDKLQKKHDNSTNRLLSARDNGATKEQLYDMAAKSLSGDNDTDARVKSENLIDSWFKPVTAVNWDAVVDVQNKIDNAAEQGTPLTNEFITMNYGAQVGSKLQGLLSRNTSARKNLANASFKRANENIKNLYKGGEFGNPKKRKAKEASSGLDTELNQFVGANPAGDPVEWLDARMKVYRQEKLAGELNSFSDRLAQVIPFREGSREAFEALTDENIALEMLGAETDEGLATRLFLDFGGNEEDLTPDVIERIKLSDEYLSFRETAPALTEKQIKKAIAGTEFQTFKLQKLQELEELNP